MQYGLYHRLLRGALLSKDLELARPALGRWLRVAVAWQLLVLAACGLYIVVLGSRHLGGYAWPAPAIGAVFGTAIPLQVVVFGIMRAARP